MDVCFLYILFYHSTTGAVTNVCHFTALDSTLIAAAESLGITFILTKVVDRIHFQFIFPIFIILLQIVFTITSACISIGRYPETVTQCYFKTLLFLSGWRYYATMVIWCRLDSFPNIILGSISAM